MSELDRDSSGAEMRLLQLVNDASDGLRQLMERWDNRLVPESTSFSERYVEGRLSVVLNLEVIGEVHWLRFCVVPIDGPCGFIPINAEVTVSNGFEGNRYGRHGRNEKPMLVVNVCIVQGVEKIVPSFVWLDDVDDCIDNSGARNPLSLPS